jgi:hypothetical protein
LLLGLAWPVPADYRPWLAAYADIFAAAAALALGFMVSTERRIPLAAPRAAAFFVAVAFVPATQVVLGSRPFANLGQPKQLATLALGLASLLFLCERRAIVAINAIELASPGAIRDQLRRSRPDPGRRAPFGDRLCQLSGCSSRFLSDPGVARPLQ